MTLLRITRGLPGSGKSTLAAEWVAEDPTSRAQVNRDSLRAMLHNSVWIGGRSGTEGATIAARDAIIKALLRKGVDVICSDTNLPQKVARDLRNLATIAGAELEVIDLTNVPLDLCLERDAERETRFMLDRDGDGGVGGDVIRGMHSRYLAGRPYPLPLPDEPAQQAAKALPYVAKPGTPETIIADVDGTVALMKEGGRGPFDWHRVGEDLPNQPVINAIMTEATFAGRDPQLIFMSGRDETCRAETVAWLAEHVCGDDETDEQGLPDWVSLYMRPEGDTRKDSIVKLQLFNEHIRDAYTVLHVWDDRDQVVRMWRELGLTVFQVAEGAF
jgi:predicted kinase